MQPNNYLAIIVIVLLAALVLSTSIISALHLPQQRIHVNNVPFHSNDNNNNNNTETCYNGDSDCPTCPDGRTESFTSIIYLSFHEEFAAKMMQAQDIIASTAERRQHIISMLPPFEYHTSVNYFCCYTKDQKEQIKSIYKEFKWAPLHLEYNDAGCNIDHDNVTVYIHSKPSPASQKVLFDFVDEIQQEIIAAGIPIINPRVQSFHSTLARVDHEYPTDEVVAQIKQHIPFFANVTIDFILVDDIIVHAC